MHVCFAVVPSSPPSARFADSHLSGIDKERERQREAETAGQSASGLAEVEGTPSPVHSHHAGPHSTTRSLCIPPPPSTSAKDACLEAFQRVVDCQKNNSGFFGSLCTKEANAYFRCYRRERVSAAGLSSFAADLFFTAGPRLDSEPFFTFTAGALFPPGPRCPPFIRDSFTSKCWA